jgi:alpha-galactosidase
MMTREAPGRKRPLTTRAAIVLLAVVVVSAVLPGSGRAPEGTTPQEASRKAHAEADGLAMTPPMGWYPWNMFGEEPQNERLIREIVDALVSSGMKDAGYAYVGPDEGVCFARGADGKLTTNLDRYPSGLRGLGDFIHDRGLKYALYTDAGAKTCSGAMPGTKGHEFEDMKAFAGWRTDYIKIDWCNSEGQDIVEAYTRLAGAQRAAGRPVVHSLCSWGDGYPWLWAGAVGHMWRTTSDICAPGKADWARAVRIAFANEKLAAHAGPGRWNDPDMMVVGMPGLSESQNRTLFSLWCLMAAPLMAGNDLRGMDEATVGVLTNLEAIAVDQDPLGAQGHVVWNDGNVSLWAGKPLFDGSQAVLLFYQGRHRASRRIEWREIGLAETDEFYVRDLWKRETSGPHKGGIDVAVGPDDVAFLRVSRKNDFPVPPIVVADRTRLSFKTAGSRPETLIGAVRLANKGSSDLAPWRVDMKTLPPWLRAGVLAGGKSQAIVNTVSTAGLKKGVYHALVRADNVEPVTGKPMSAVYYDVDLEVVRDVRR